MTYRTVQSHSYSIGGILHTEKYHSAAKESDNLLSSS